MSGRDLSVLSDPFLTPACPSASSSLCHVSLFPTYYAHSVSRVLSLLVYYCVCVTTKLLAADWCLRHNRARSSYIISPLAHPQREACECTNTFWTKSNAMVPCLFLDKLRSHQSRVAASLQSYSGNLRLMLCQSQAPPLFFVNTRLRIQHLCPRAGGRVKRMLPRG